VITLLFKKIVKFELFLICNIQIRRLVAWTRASRIGSLRHAAIWTH